MAWVLAPILITIVLSTWDACRIDTDVSPNSAPEQQQAVPPLEGTTREQSQQYCHGTWFPQQQQHGRRFQCLQQCDNTRHDNVSKGKCGANGLSRITNAHLQYLVELLQFDRRLQKKQCRSQTPANSHLVIPLAKGDVAAASRAFSNMRCRRCSFCLQ